MTTSILGNAVRRVEDPRSTGSLRSVDDLHLRVEGALRACFVRSIMAHARAFGIATTEAAKAG